MAGRGQGPDFVEALARGLDVIAAFGRERPQMSLSEVAQATDLARPTARRLLLTLEELGYVRSRDGVFSLTPRVLALGTAYVGVPRPVGDRPPAAGGPRGAHRGVVVDGPARRLGHRLRRAGVGAQDHRAAGRGRHALPGAADVTGQGAARRARPSDARRGARPAQPLGAARPRRAAAGGAGGGARPRAGPGVGARRRGAGTRACARWPCRCATAPVRCGRR